jgi:hypothetical protein
LTFDALPTSLQNVWIVVKHLTVGVIHIACKNRGQMYSSHWHNARRILGPTKVRLVTAQFDNAVVFLLLTANKNVLWFFTSREIVVESLPVLCQYS